MTSRLLFQPDKKQAQVRPNEPGGPHRLLIPVIIGAAGLLLLGLLAVPVLVGTNLFFAASEGCSGQQTGAVGQPTAGPKAKTIPANYLFWYKKVGQQYGVPWTILAGIGTVESNNGQTTLPGVHSDANAFGAAGPMQIGIRGAAGNVWGGAPVHPAGEVVNGVATDEDGGPNASVYDPADAIAGAANYLLEFDVQTNPSAAIFAYNHLQSYVQSVLMYAGQYAGGNFSVASAQLPAANSAAGCVQTAGGVPAVQAPTQAVAAVISFAEQQLGKPYLWGGTGPDAFDCSGLMMMAYRTAGISIARTSQAQWASETRVPASQVQPGDLVFFAGADGTVTDPGHVGLVVGGGKMIEAYATGFPIRVSSYASRGAIGFTEPWAGAKGTTPASTPSPGSPGSTGAPGAPGAPAPPKGGIPIPGSAIPPSTRTTG
ncbi:MAG: NlpC/P60 family protein [Streptosporangiaceae bacterium]